MLRHIRNTTANPQFSAAFQQKSPIDPNFRLGNPTPPKHDHLDGSVSTRPRAREGRVNFLPVRRAPLQPASVSNSLHTSTRFSLPLVVARGG
jgi:hypothetical protein